MVLGIQGDLPDLRHAEPASLDRKSGPRLPTPSRVRVFVTDSASRRDL